MHRVFVLLAAVFGVMSAPVAADVVVFQNPGAQLVWNPLNLDSTCPGGPIGAYLDVTLPASQIPDVQGASTLSYDACSTTNAICILNTYRCYLSAEVALAPDLIRTEICALNPVDLHGVRLYAPGEVVGPDSMWATEGAFASSRATTGQFIFTNYPGAIGFRFPRKGLMHYAFVVLAGPGLPVAWGYETTPETPLVVPWYNDDCVGAMGIYQHGVYAFDAGALTTSAPDLSACAFQGAPEIAGDAWFRFVSPNAGDMLVSTRGLTDLDTRVAIYATGSCAGAVPVACNDNDGPDGPGAQASTIFFAEEDAAYLIRVGVAPGAAAGAGAFRIALTRPRVLRGPVVHPTSDSVYHAVEPGSWLAVQADARYGDIVAINNMAENQFVLDAFGDLGPQMWVGLSDAFREGDWDDTVGSPTPFTNWAPGFPVSSDVLDFAAMDTTTGLWTNLPNRPAALPFAVIETRRSTNVAAPVVHPVTGHAYFLLSRSNWLDALTLGAYRLGASLVTINDAAENEFIRTTFAQHFGDPLDGLWTGLHDHNLEGVYQWASGEASAYRNWQAGAPDNSNNEDYVLMYRSGVWNDVVNAPPPGYARFVVGLAELDTLPLIAGPFHRPGSCQRYVVTAPGTWLRAKGSAIARGGALVTIDDPQEEQWLSAIVQDQGISTFWIGYSSEPNNSGARWVDGAPTVYSNWLGGRPPWSYGNSRGTIIRIDPAPLRWWGRAPDYQLHASVAELPPRACPCDWQEDGSVSSQDFFDFLTAFFNDDADVTCDGATNSEDFFDFLRCFFDESGCE